MDVNPDMLSQYFADYVRKGFRNIFDEQRRIAANKIYSRQAYRTDGSPRSRSGRLQAALEAQQMNINASGGSLEANVDYPSYIRFLDMKRLGNYKIYNRPIWGILYKQTFVELRYEFSDWLRRFTRQSLQESLNP